MSQIFSAGQSTSAGYASPQNLLAATSVNPLSNVANSVIASNRALFSDGTEYWSAGPAYASTGCFIDDCMLAMMAYPQYFTAAQVLNVVAKFMANLNGNGEIPTIVGANGVTPPGGWYSAWDQHHAFASGDGWINVINGLYLYFRKTGDTGPYSNYVAALKTALARLPRNATNHLITVNAGNEYVAGMQFMEYMRKTGDDANASVWYAVCSHKLALMAAAAGDATNSSFFSSEYANVVAGIQSTLIDGTSGLLIAATGQCSSNLDVVSSSLACFYELLTATQELAIANYFMANYSTLVNADGYVLQSPTPWATVGYIPAGGAAPYGASPYTGSQYQGGFWSFHVGWFAYTLAKASRAQAATLLNTYLNGVDPATEWFNRGSAAPQGTTPNLVSPSGARMAADFVPAALTYTSGCAAVTMYGAGPALPASPTFSGAATVQSRVVVGPGVPSLTPQISLISADAAAQVIDIQNVNPAGVSGFNFSDSSGTSVAGFAYGNTSFALTHLRGATYVYGAKLALSNNPAVAGNGLVIQNGRMTASDNIQAQNSTTDTPGIVFQFVADGTQNFGIDSADSGSTFGCSGQLLRFVRNLDQSGGALVAVMDLNGNMGIPGSFQAARFTGPATAPTGSSGGFVGWCFSQDGHISYADGSTWTLKI